MNRSDPDGEQSVSISVTPIEILVEGGIKTGGEEAAPVIGPRGTPLNPLSELPEGAANGPSAGKNFTRTKPTELPRCMYCNEQTTREPGKNQHNNEHIIPKSRNGNTTPPNRGDACRLCNQSKGARTPKQWYESLSGKLKGIVDSILNPPPPPPPPPPKEVFVRA